MGKRWDPQYKEFDTRFEQSNRFFSPIEADEPMPKCWSKRVGYCGKPRLLPADGEGGKDVKQGQSHIVCLDVQKGIEDREGVSTFGERRQPGGKSRWKQLSFFAAQKASAGSRVVR